MVRNRPVLLIYRTHVMKGETLADAIRRCEMVAERYDYDRYEICCCLQHALDHYTKPSIQEARTYV